MIRIELDPRRDAEAIEALRALGYNVAASEPGTQEEPRHLRPSSFLTPRHAFWAWVAYFTVRNPSWPLWALVWAVLFVLIIASSLSFPQP